MDYTIRRPRLRRGRRYAVTLSMSPKTIKGLSKIRKGNRSAAVEMLVEWYLEREGRRLEELGEQRVAADTVPSTDGADRSAESAL